MKKIIYFIIDILITTLFLVWIIDYSNVTLKKEPMFCITKNTNTYKDGTTTSCTSLGYKVIKYDRNNLTKGYTYGTIFMKEVGVD